MQGADRLPAAILVDFEYENGHTNSMKIAISIPDDLFEAAEALATRFQISRSELYRRAVTAYLRRTSRQAVTEALDSVYGDDPGAGELDPAVAWLQAASRLRKPLGKW